MCAERFRKPEVSYRTSFCVSILVHILKIVSPAAKSHKTRTKHRTATKRVATCMFQWQQYFLNTLQTVHQPVLLVQESPASVSFQVLPRGTCHIPGRWVDRRGI